MPPIMNGHSQSQEGFTNGDIDLTNPMAEDTIDVSKYTSSTTAAHPTSQSSPERRTYLFGHPIAHSLSPVVHNAVFSSLELPWTYTLHESLSIQSFLELIHREDFQGSAVTMPHKVQICQHLDALTDEAEKVGACNTVFIQRDEVGRKRYVGTNTDVVGIREAFWRNVPNAPEVLHNRPSLVIGGGGAARSAIYVLHAYFKSPTIYMINRLRSEVDAIIADCQRHGYGSNIVYIEDAKHAQDCQAVGAVVGCVPDFPPVTDGEKEARRCVEIMLGKKNEATGTRGALLEMAYHPRIHTSLGALAEEEGWQVVLGTEAMLYQGLEQDRLWTGVDVDKMPVAKVKAVLEKAVASAASH